VKLLFDENLSPRLVAYLADIFPDSMHVHSVGLGSLSDREVWDFAREHSYTLVSKDSDFHELSLLLGYPPKVVWIKRGNCNNKQIELILRNKATHIEALGSDPEAAFLLLL
jgi:predicted nuclease of predicted toxin-antitoxin system